MAVSGRHRGWRWDEANSRLSVYVNGTEAARYDDTAPYLSLLGGLSIASGTYIDFEAAAAAYATLLRDVNNNELLATQGVASAITYLGISNAATGAGPIISSQGETNTDLNLLMAGTGALIVNNGTDPVIIKLLGAQGGYNNEIHDVNGNEILALQGVASAVGELTITNAATTVGPTIGVQGETNLPLNLAAAGTGAITLNNGTDPVILKVLGAQAGMNNEIQDVNGNEIMALQGVASAVNELTVTNAATTAAPTIGAQGDDANISIGLLAKGTGVVSINNGTDPVVVQLLGAQAGMNNEVQDVNGNEILALQGVASAVNELTVTNAATTAAPAIGAQGGDANISIALTPKGTGAVAINNDTDPVMLRLDGAQDGFNSEITDVNGNELLAFRGLASAIDEIMISNGSVGGGAPLIGTQGDSANVDLNILLKGTGALRLNNGTDPVALLFLGAQAGMNNEIQDVNGNEILGMQGVASAVNELTITNAATGGVPTISVQGDDAAIGSAIDTKGTGTFTIQLGGDEVLRFHDLAAMTFAAAAATAGHAAYVQTEDGGAAATDTNGHAAGALEIRTGDGSAPNGTGTTGGAGGGLVVVGGAGAAGGATGTGGAGGAATIRGGDGGGTSGAGTGGAGGNVVLDPGAQGVTVGGTDGVPGHILGLGKVLQRITNTAMADTAAISVAAMRGGLINGVPTGAAAYTTPTAAELVADVPGAEVGTSYWLLINNNSAGANTITLTGGANVTIDGTATVAQNVSRLFLVNFTNVTGAAETVTIYGC